MARQADDADVVRVILTAELGAEADAMRLLEDFFLQLDVAEGTSTLAAAGRQVVVVVG